MASFTGVGDSLELLVPAKDTDIDIAISGTYNMTILFQVEQGSKGSGAWLTINTYSTEDATVAAKYRTRADNENVRLIVTVDTSGTATATLTDNDDKVIKNWHDFNGNILMSLLESGLRLPNGIIRASNSIVSLAANTTITQMTHAGRVMLFNAASGLTAALPAAVGSGNLYTFVVATTVTTNDYIIAVASASDILQGGILLATDTGGITVPTAADSDTITMNGSTTGGIKGSILRIQDVASGLFTVEGFVISTGAESTPFSAAVS